MLALAIIERLLLAVVGRQHRQLAIRVGVPRIQSDAVAPTRIVVRLLQHVQILERAATVAFDGIVLPHDVHLLVVDILFFVVIAILVLVWR